MRVIAILALAATAALAQTPPAPKAAGKTAATATKSGAPAAPRANPLLNPAALRAKAPEEFQARFTTTKGDIVVDVHRAWSPLGADRFYNLVRNRFFTNAAFFRVVPNFIVQFGMHADPAINKVWQNANIKDDPPSQSNKRTYVVFATAGPNTRTTQLFINLKDNAFLDAQGFTPFGVVTEGMDLVTQIYSGYGEAPDQGMIAAQGKAYLDKNFPKLDFIKSAIVVGPATTTGPPAAAKKAPTAATPAATKTGTKTGAPAAKKSTAPASPAKKTAPAATPEKK